MDAYASPFSNVCNSYALVTTQRRYDTDGAPYRVMLLDGNMRACAAQGATAYPMASGVMDDFGTITLTGAWE